MKTKYLYRFIIICFSVVFILSCSKDDSIDPLSDDENTEESDLVHVVMRVIQDSGLDFPQSSSSGNRGEARVSEFLWPAEDYVTVDESDSEIILVKIWLGPDNHIISTPDWQIANPEYCLGQGKYMLPARKLLQFKIHNIPRDDIRSVQLNHIDVISQGVEHSVITDYYEADPDWMYHAMSEVWDEMLNQTTIKGAVEPCDNVIPLTLHFNSIVTFDTPETLVYEEIEFIISLQFNESEEAFIGVSEFVWLEGYAWDKEEDDYHPYPPNKSGAMEIVKLITPILAGNSIENASMNFRVPKPSPENSSILLLAFAEFYTSESTQADTVEFRIDNWQLLDDPEIIMAAYINNQITVDEGVLTETTIFEIVQ